MECETCNNEFSSEDIIDGVCDNCTTFTVDIKNEDIYSLRDIALELEDIDINKAYKLMSLASKLRPSGSFITMKLEEYKNKIIFS